MNLSIFTKGLILLTVTLAFHLGLLGLIAHLQWRYAEAQRLADHSQKVIRDVRAVLRSIEAAETGVRRFAITPRAKEFAEPYDRAVEEVPAALRLLRSEVADNPGQSARARRIADAADACLAWLAGAARLVRAENRRDAVVSLVDGENQRFMDQFRGEVDSFLAEESRLAKHRGAALEGSRKQLNGILFVGGVAVVLVTGALALVFWRGISRRFATLTAAAERLAKGETPPPPLAGEDEIARADRALREMAAELREALHEMRDLYDNAPCGYHSVDANGVYVAMNKTELRWLGYSEAEVVGRLTRKEILNSGSQAAFDAAMAALVERGEVYDVEYEMVRKDGTTLPVLVSATAIRDAAGKYVASRSTVIDLTHRKRADDTIRRLNNDLERRVQERTTELAAANRDLSQKNQENEMFVYSVSHDLRSPLVNLQGFSGELEKGCRALAALLADDGLPPDVRAHAQAVLDGKMAKSVGFIKTAVLRLGSIIDALLRLSRAGRVEYRRELVDMNRVVASVVGAVHGTIQERGATVSAGDLPPVRGDRGALEQVFANLVGNALAYAAPDRPPAIEIGCRPAGHPDAPGHLVYYVADNGLGVAAAYQQKIFQIFQRAHPGVGQGEGIGLAIVARVVERHHGRVWVESTAGQGSTFFVALPAGSEAS